MLNDAQSRFLVRKRRRGGDLAREPPQKTAVSPEFDINKKHQPQGNKIAPRNGCGERGGYDLLKGRLVSWVNPRFLFAGTALDPESEGESPPAIVPVGPENRALVWLHEECGGPGLS
jgi:hypothetical protein